MNFIDKIRMLTVKSVDRNMKFEYKNAIKKVKSAANEGRYEVSFCILKYYDNKDDIYLYVVDKLKSKGFKVDINKNQVANKFITISWEQE